MTATTQTRGRAQWRSLEEKRGARREEPSREPEGASEPGLVDAGALTRRGFMTLSGATAAAVGLAGCIRRPQENILPFTQGVEYVVPGVPLHFATVTERRGDAVGLLVTSHDGRPTKVEGNPDHPSSGGAADLWAQAGILDLYDPDRSKGPRRGDDTFATVREGWTELGSDLEGRLSRHASNQGRGLRFLMQPTNSPTSLRTRTRLRERFPEARIHTYTAISDSNVREGGRLAFGQPVTTLYRFDAARYILALDSDFLHAETGALRWARGFADGRRMAAAAQEMNRLYVVEPNHSVTGSLADHRLRVPGSRVHAFLRALAAKLAAEHGIDLSGVGVGAAETSDLGPRFDHFVDHLARELGNREHHGQSAIVVGSRQPPAVHALAHVLNSALGNAGRTVAYLPVTDPSEKDQLPDLRELTDAMSGGEVSTLVILGGNPVYDAPADLSFASALSEVEWSAHLSSHFDETSRACTWHGNRAHELETWGDQRALDGTVSVQQPLIAPLWGARSDLELLAIAAGERNWRGHSMVRATMRLALPPGVSVDATWRRSLHSGSVTGTTGRPAAAPPIAAESIVTAIRELDADGGGGPFDGYELSFVPCNKLFDGRYANNPWLLELPENMTKMVWDNAALIGPETAEELGVDDGDMVEISHDGRSITLPVWRLPGIAPKVVTLALGWGRGDAAGRYARIEENYGGGFDVNPLRTTSGFWYATGAAVRKASGKHFLALTQEHDSMTDMGGFERPIALEATLAEYREQPDFASYRAVDMVQPHFPGSPDRPAPGDSLWERVDYSEGHAWGMVIDLTSCTGCNACVVACQAENNIPAVGKRQVARGREMSWIRIDRYFAGDENEPEVALQPIACQQCEEAPCENVCPVNATTHTPEGLNDMAYNRCIGTRYCANNCPYKVRRFNYLPWHGYLEDRRANYDEIPETRQMQFNPNVTVRMRGVMEKCTYCVQRIQEAKIGARRDAREMADGDVTPACAQTCPAQAIVFGDLNDADSRVARAAAQDRRYKLLQEVGTRPRTTFLARIRNPNPDLASALAGGGEEEAEG